MFEKSRVTCGDLTALSYVAGCVYEALESNTPRQIPKEIRECASALLASAVKWAQKQQNCTPEDNESYNKVSKVIAYNLTAAGIKKITREVIACEIVRISYDFEIVCGDNGRRVRYNKNALLRFFHSMSEVGET